MRTVSCDVAIIGAGTAGLAARSAAVKAGAKTILIESGEGGTTCARVGCMPSKLLLRAGAAAKAIGQSKLFGVSRSPKPKIDGRGVLARVRRERDYFVKSVLDEVAKIPPSTRISGHARFISPNALAVGHGVTVKAKSIVIAAGARPVVPEEFSGMGNRILTHESVFGLKKLPKSAAIVGAGPLGIEFAVAFARLGVRVAVFDTGKTVGGIEDDDVRKVASKSLSGEFDLHLGVSLEAARRAGGIGIRWKSRSGRKGTSIFEYVLAASGRSPHLNELDLKITGVELNKKGIPVFNPNTMKCGESSIFIAGDVDNDRPVLHEASRQGELAGRNAARNPKIDTVQPWPLFSIVFTDPDIAKVGLSLSELMQDGAQGVSEDNGRARIDGSNCGMLKVYARRSDRTIAGAEMFGLDVEHLAHLLAWAIKLKLTVDDALELPFYHPTVEEGLRTALRNLKSNMA